MRNLSILAATGLALVACGRSRPHPRAAADLDPRSGTAVTGHADFVETGHGVDVTITLAGATPGQHGVHLHQIGDCRATDAASAGDHWNPDAMAHGGPHMATHHAGDLGNIDVGADGRGTLKLSVPGLTVGSGPHSVVGHSIVVHGGTDDLSTQPAGNSGPRIACGVIAVKLR